MTALRVQQNKRQTSLDIVVKESENWEFETWNDSAIRVNVCSMFAHIQFTFSRLFISHNGVALLRACCFWIEESEEKATEFYQIMQ